MVLVRNLYLGNPKHTPKNFMPRPRAATPSKVGTWTGRLATDGKAHEIASTKKVLAGRRPPTSSKEGVKPNHQNGLRDAQKELRPSRVRSGATASRCMGVLQDLTLPFPPESSESSGENTSAHAATTTLKHTDTVEAALGPAYAKARACSSHT